MRTFTKKLLSVLLAAAVIFGNTAPVSAAGNFGDIFDYGGNEPAYDTGDIFSDTNTSENTNLPPESQDSAGEEVGTDSELQSEKPAVMMLTGDAAAPAASIGETGYATLHGAFEAAVENDTIVLQKDVVFGAEEEPAESIFVDKTLTLELGGYKIVGSLLTTPDAEPAVVNGVLRVEGSGNLTVNGGTVVNTLYQGSGDVRSNLVAMTVSSGGSLTLNSVNVSGVKSDAVNGSGDLTLYKDIRAIDNGGSLTVNGGYIYGAESRYSIRKPVDDPTIYTATAIVNMGDVTVNRGEIAGVRCRELHASRNAFGINSISGSVAVSGGTICGADCSNNMYASMVIGLRNQHGGRLTVSQGEIYGGRIRSSAEGSTSYAIDLYDTAAEITGGVIIANTASFAPGTEDIFAPGMQKIVNGGIFGHPFGEGGNAADLLADGLTTERGSYSFGQWTPQQSGSRYKVIDPAVKHDVTFRVEGLPDQVIQVEEGQPIGDRMPENPTVEGKNFLGWVSGGEEVTRDTVVRMPMLVEAQLEVIPVANPAARIGQTEYATLHEAAAAAESGATVTMLRDVVFGQDNEPHTQLVLRDVTLELGGYQLCGSIVDAEHPYEAISENGLISVSGNVTISGGTIVGIRWNVDTPFTSMGSAAVAVEPGGTLNLSANVYGIQSSQPALDIQGELNAIYNQGTLNVNSGYVVGADSKFTTKDTSGNGAMITAINCFGTEAVALNIGNAQVYGIKGTQVDAYVVGVGISANGTVTIQGQNGTPRIMGAYVDRIYGPGMMAGITTGENSTLTVSNPGAEVYGAKCNTMENTSALAVSANSGTISAGLFVASSAVPDAMAMDLEGALQVTGGTFGHDFAEGANNPAFLASGKAAERGRFVDGQWTPAADGTYYKVVDAETFSVTAKVNGNAVDGENLVDVIAKSGVAADAVSTLEFVSGYVSYDDLHSAAMLPNLTTFQCNLNETLTVQKAENGNVEFPNVFGASPEKPAHQKLETVELDGFSWIMPNAFEECPALRSVTANQVTTVDQQAFHRCTALTTVTMPELQEIRMDGFAGTTALKTIDLGKIRWLYAGAFIDSGVFRNEKDVLEVTLPATLIHMNLDVFGHGNISDGTPRTPTVFHVTMENSTPSKLDMYNVSPFSNPEFGSCVVVPEGAEEAYRAHFAYKAEDNTWSGLHLGELAAYTVTFRRYGGAEQTYEIYEGDTIGSRLPNKSRVPSDMWTYGWFTEDGEEILPETKVYGPILAIERVEKYVATADGVGCPTLHAAIEAAQEGGIVEVYQNVTFGMEGEPAEPIRITKSLTLDLKTLEVIGSLEAEDTFRAPFLVESGSTFTVRGNAVHGHLIGRKLTEYTGTEFPETAAILVQPNGSVIIQDGKIIGTLVDGDAASISGKAIDCIPGSGRPASADIRIEDGELIGAWLIGHASSESGQYKGVGIHQPAGTLTLSGSHFLQGIREYEITPNVEGIGIHMDSGILNMEGKGVVEGLGYGRDLNEPCRAIGILSTGSEPFTLTANGGHVQGVNVRGNIGNQTDGQTEIQLRGVEIHSTPGSDRHINLNGAAAYAITRAGDADNCSAYGVLAENTEICMNGGAIWVSGIDGTAGENFSGAAICLDRGSLTVNDGILAGGDGVPVGSSGTMASLNLIRGTVTLNGGRYLRNSQDMVFSDGPYVVNLTVNGGIFAHDFAVGQNNPVWLAQDRTTQRGNLDGNVWTPAPDGSYYKVIEQPVPQGVCMVKETNTGYETVAAAVAAAKPGQTIRLLTDAKEAYVNLYGGVTLDLNGRNLTANGLNAFKGNHVMDSSAEKGVLTVSGQNLILPQDNRQMPLYNGTGYIFGAMTMQQKDLVTTDAGYKLVFKPLFVDKVTSEAYFADGAADNNLVMGLRAVWTKDGDTITQDFVYDDAKVGIVYNAAAPQAYSATLFGFPAGAQVQIFSIVKSDAHQVVAMGAAATVNIPQA